MNNFIKLYSRSKQNRFFARNTNKYIISKNLHRSLHEANLSKNSKKLAPQEASLALKKLYSYNYLQDLKMSYYNYYYIAICRFWDKSKFCSKVYFLEASKTFKILKMYYNDGSNLTPLEKTELKDGFIQIIKSIPFIFTVVIPGAELAVPVLLYIYPNIFPESLLMIIKHDVDCYEYLLSMMINFWDLMLMENLKNYQNDTMFHRLSNRKIRLKLLEMRRRLTIRDLAEIIQKFQVLYFFKYATNGAIRFTLRQMGIDINESRDLNIYNIIFKAHRIKSEDHYLYHNCDLETIGDERLFKLCIDRGICCVGNDRSRLIKRLTRWLCFSITMEVEVVFMYLTRVSQYDLTDLLSEIIDGSNCEIVNGIRKIFETDPNIELNETYKYSVEIVKTMLSGYIKY